MLPKEITEDTKLLQMYIRRNLSDRRIESYIRVFRKIYEMTGMTPTKILEIAKEEQKPKLKDGGISFIELEDRTITEIQYGLYSKMISEGLKNETIKTEMAIYRAFLNEYDIQLPKGINLKCNKPLYEAGDLPTKEDILRAINSTNNKRDKALIYFMSSSGIRSVDVRSLKIRDLLQGCEYYLGKDATLEDLYSSEYEEIIPNFFFRPQKTNRYGNICCTFCSNEATRSIIEYLQSRHIKSEEEYLFQSKNNTQIARASLIDVFKRINDREFGVNRYGDRYFQAKHLRKYFITTCNVHTGDLLKVRLLAGHSLSDIDRAYNEINVNVMRRFYIGLLPYLNLHSTDVKTVKSKEYQDLELKLKRQELENRKLKEELDDKIASVVHDVLEKYK